MTPAAYTNNLTGSIVTLCDKVRERCPEFPGDAGLIHWSIEDPSDTTHDDAATYPRFQRTPIELETRISFLISIIDNAPTTRSTPR